MMALVMAPGGHEALSKDAFLREFGVEDGVALGRDLLREAIDRRDSVDALVHLSQWVPSYLEFDDARALAMKAIWALGAITGDAARRALEALARSECNIVAEGAVAQLQR